MLGAAELLATVTVVGRHSGLSHSYEAQGVGPPADWAGASRFGASPARRYTVLAMSEDDRFTALCRVKTKVFPSFVLLSRVRICS